MSAETFTRVVTVTNPHGLHARPANVIIKTVRKYDAQVTIQNGSQVADATSIFDVMLLAATQGTVLVQQTLITQEAEERTPRNGVD